MASNARATTTTESRRYRAPACRGRERSGTSRRSGAERPASQCDDRRDRIQPHRNGRGRSGLVARSSMTANTWPMNCTRILVVINASITRPSGSRLQRIQFRPSTSSEMWGNAWSGAAVQRSKKYPSLAAACFREYPRSRANTDPNAVHKMRNVNTVAIAARTTAP